MKIHIIILSVLFFFVNFEPVWAQQKDSVVFDFSEIDRIISTIDADSLGAPYSSITRLSPVPIVNIIDSSFLTILDTVLLMEKKCNYFSIDLCIDVLFARIKDSNVVNNQYYHLHIELDKEKPKSEHKLVGYFKYRGRDVFLFDLFGLPDQLFSYTGENKRFDYRIDSDFVIYDDRYSMYFYWYINRKFYLHEIVNKCN
jgi:hypothetical protein